MQRAASESVAAATRGNMYDRSLVAPASAVCRGEPAGVRHTRGFELGIHTGDACCIEKCCVLLSFVQLFVIKPVFFLQDGSLALSSSLHSEVALLVAEAYQKYLTDKPYSGLISEGIKQVTHPLLAHRR